MKKYPLIGKGLAVGIILLFIGVAVAPSINFTVVKASNDNDIIEVTTQACGIKGVGNTTVKLTRQQYQNLEQYLVDFRARLNQTTTREEAVPIFKEAVVELNKYGLLPKGMGVEQLQKLVTCEYQNEKIMKAFEKIYQKNSGILNNSNYFCLISGETSNVSFYGFPVRSLLKIDNFLYKYFVFIYTHFKIIPKFSLLILFILNGLILNLIYDLSPYPSFPMKLINYIQFGSQGTLFTSPSQGWIHSFGLLGNKGWENSFFGDILPVGFGVFGVWGEIDFGAAGFTGISISTQQTQTTFFLGSAYHIQIRQA